MFERIALIFERIASPFERIASPFERIASMFERIALMFERIAAIFERSAISTLTFGCRIIFTSPKMVAISEGSAREASMVDDLIKIEVQDMLWNIYELTVWGT